MSNTQDNENKIKETLAKLVKYVPANATTTNLVKTTFTDFVDYVASHLADATYYVTDYGVYFNDTTVNDIANDDFAILANFLQDKGDVTLVGGKLTLKTVA